MRKRSGQAFLALVGPFGGFRRRRQTFLADVNLNDGAFGDAGRVDALDLPMADTARGDCHEVEALGIAEVGKIDE